MSDVFVEPLANQNQIQFSIGFDDLNEFKAWLNLNLTNIAWEGRSRSSFEDFWHDLFVSQNSIVETLSKLDYCRKFSASGPLYSWLSWLRQQYLLFAFFKSDLTLDEFCLSCQISHSELGGILRNYFIGINPIQQDLIDETIQVGSLFSEARHYKMREFLTQFGLKDLLISQEDESMMTNLEVTLFAKWPQMLREVRKDSKILQIDYYKKNKKKYFNQILIFTKEVIVLFAISVLAIWSVKKINFYYEDFILKKIKLLEPNFFSFDSFKLYKPDDIQQRSIELSNEEIEKLEKIEKAVSFDEIKDVRFDPESDEVVLTSVEEIPDTDEVDSSQFEQSLQGSFRDFGPKLGRTRSYRVLLTSVDSKKITTKLTEIIKAYNAKTLGNNKNGNTIPGGVYFNLNVPQKKLKSLLSAISELSDATIFESLSREPAPLGENRVFVWVKSI